MLPAAPTIPGALFYDGFVLVFALWLGSSAFVVINRLLHDRRQRRLASVTRELVSPSVASLPPLERSPAIRKILSRTSRREVYRMISRDDLPPGVTEICAAYAIDRWGLKRLLTDAAPDGGGRKWRRISALFALGYMRADRVHELLALAAFDPDADVARAALVILNRLGDRRAAEILVLVLRQRPDLQSTIAKQLERFTIPIADLLRPLLIDPRPTARYWAASLLIHYPEAPGLEPEMARLTEDTHPSVRKAALETLSVVAGAVATVVGRRLLDDPVPYVRSTAIRTLARGGKHGDVGSRQGLAAAIAPSLADRAWEVRLAAKEALVTLGREVWREVAAQLDSPDEFARNGAAEVLQNLCLLERAMEDLDRGVPPSAELVDVLARALQVGGPGMVDAAIARLESAA